MILVTRCIHHSSQSARSPPPLLFLSLLPASRSPPLILTRVHFHLVISHNIYSPKYLSFTFKWQSSDFQSGNWKEKIVSCFFSSHLLFFSFLIFFSFLFSSSSFVSFFSVKEKVNGRLCATFFANQTCNQLLLYYFILFYVIFYFNQGALYKLPMTEFNFLIMQLILLIIIRFRREISFSLALWPFLI